MTVEIICPKCERAMQEGFVIDRGSHGVRLAPAWVEGVPEESFWSGLKTNGKQKFTVRAFRCPQCNYLEFYTAEQVYL